MSWNIRPKKGFEIEFYLPSDDVAGLFCVDAMAFGWNVSFHLLMRKSHSKDWGYHESWYDGPLYFLSAGPLFNMKAEEAAEKKKSEESEAKRKAKAVATREARELATLKRLQEKHKEIL